MIGDTVEMIRLETSRQTEVSEEPTGGTDPREQVDVHKAK
jgi:hypothetical protein